MWFGVLGPVEVRSSADGSVLAVGGPRPRSLLAMLALEAGRVAEAEGLLAEARTRYRQAVELAQDNRIPATAADALAGLARLAAR